MSSTIPLTVHLGIFLFSAATLAFEINLTRLFSVAQFYHFAFLIVSLALLGFGASGTALAVFPKLGRSHPQGSLSRLSLGCAASILGAYLLTNGLPFDSFSVAWDWRQIGVLILHLLALATPFFFSGMGVGLMLSAAPHAASQTYAVNLAGSALGCVIVWVAPAWLGGEGMVTLCASLAAGAGWIASWGEATPLRHINSSSRSHARQSLVIPTHWLAAGMLMVCLLDLGLRLTGHSSFAWLTLRLSPYKGLSYAQQYPGAKVIYRQWSSFSRVDVVSSSGIRSLPGLSYLSPHPPPPEHGLLVDGDDLSPIMLPDADTGFAGYMPPAIAYQLRPQAQTLVLEPRGGLDLVIALALGAPQVTAVEVNPLVVEAAGSIYADPRVWVVIESDRSYLRRSRERFDVVVFSLIMAHHPVRSGAYSLAEDYRYTVEAFEDALARLNPGGLLVVTRWLQTPPSEELRAFALAVTAVERAGGDPSAQIIAFRGYNTGTLLVKNRPFSPEEVDTVRAFANSRAFDLIYAPGIRPDEVNQHNILLAPIYYQAFTALLNADPRGTWYAAYPFDVRPPTDDRPFFGQFFKWSQAPQVVAELGKTWQPFGGAGYFVLLVLLGLAAMMAAMLILLPLMVRARRVTPGGMSDLSLPHTAQRASVTRLGLIYFGWIGLAFLLIEIPLVQRFILFLGHPAYALTAVLFTLLLFSGLGSLAAHWLVGRPALATLVLMAIGLPWLLPYLFALGLGLPFMWRLIGTMIVLAPLGFLMGLPFPLGLRWLEREAPGLIPWAWGVNGAASVVASVLAALLALSFGFSWVLVAGAVCYAGAWLTARRWAAPYSSPYP